MRIALIAAAWVTLSVIVTISYSWGATIGWRRGWAEGYEAARVDRLAGTIRLDRPGSRNAAVRASRGVR